MHLSIPAIGVDAPVSPVGLAADGAAEVPADVARVGWHEPGGRPGAPGPTALLGHVDSRRGPGVFVRLHELELGDELEVILADGTAAAYVVTRTTTSPKEALPTVEVFGATLDDELRLVTCTGPFDPAARSYLDNLVVEAERAR